MEAAADSPLRTIIKDAMTAFCFSRERHDLTMNAYLRNGAESLQTNVPVNAQHKSLLSKNCMA